MEFEEVERSISDPLRKKGYIDNILVETEVKGPQRIRPARRNWTKLAKKISSRIRKSSGSNVPVNILPQDTIERSIGKAKRIIDER